MTPAAPGLGNGDLAIVSGVAGVLDELECGDSVTEFVRLDLERHLRGEEIRVPDDPYGAHQWLPGRGGKQLHALAAEERRPDGMRCVLALLLGDLETLSDDQRDQMGLGHDRAVANHLGARGASAEKQRNEEESYRL